MEVGLVGLRMLLFNRLRLALVEQAWQFVFLFLVLSDKGSFGVIAWYTKLVKSLSGDYRLVMAYIPEDHAENFLPVFDLESTPTDAEVEEFVRRAASSPDIGPNDPSSSHALSKLPDDINARVIDAARQKA